jgi:hypothetical protein
VPRPVITPAMREHARAYRQTHPRPYSPPRRTAPGTHGAHCYSDGVLVCGWPDSHAATAPRADAYPRGQWDG